MSTALNYPSYLTEYMERCCAAEKEGLAVASDPLVSVPYFVYWQETFPYITHRLGEDTDVSTDDDQTIDEVTIIGRFVCGHVGKGFKGETERLIYVFAPLIKALYRTNVYLTSNPFPDEMEEFSPDPITYQRGTGTRVFDNSGIGGDQSAMPRQIGFEFFITTQFVLPLNRQY